MKKVKKEKILEYTVLFEPAEEGGYVVTVPKLYGLTTEGETFEDAKIMAEDAIRGYIESLIATGKEVPEELSSRPGWKQKIFLNSVNFLLPQTLQI